MTFHPDSWALLTAVVLNLVFVFAWFGFHEGPWLRLSGLTKGRARQNKTAVLVFMACSIPTAVLLAWLTDAVGNRSFLGGGLLGALLWLGFTLAVSLPEYVFSKRSLKLWWINTAPYAVSFFVQGGLLTVWK